MTLFGNFRYPVISVMVLAAALSGCVGQSPPATHYLLKAIETPRENDHQAAAESMPLKIQVGPVLLPTYLDRPQMVFLSDENRVTIDHFNRWAEPLSDSFARVIVENLSVLLKTDYVDRHTFQKKASADYRISIDVKRFDATPGREAVLIASWAIYSVKDRSQVLDKRYSARKPMTTNSASEMVAALNEMINDFSREMAAAIRSQGGQV